MAAAVPGGCLFPAARHPPSTRPTHCARSAALRRTVREELFFCARATTAPALRPRCGASQGDDSRANLLLAQDDARPPLPACSDGHVSNRDQGGAWFDQACLFHPIVVPPPQDPQSLANTWRMYYYGRPGATWGGGVPALLTTGWVGVAESTNGLTWTRVAGPGEGGAVMGPRAEPPGDEQTQERNDQSPPPLSNPTPGPQRLAQGTSPEGAGQVTVGGWGTFPEPAFDSAHVACGDVLPPDGTGKPWRMYYFGGAKAPPARVEQQAVTGSAAAPGGKGGDAVAGRASAGQQQSPAQRPGVCMRIGLATSPDGMCFPSGASRPTAPGDIGLPEAPSMSRSREPLLDVGGSGEWDSLFVAWPRVVALRDQPGCWLMTYSSMHTGEGAKAPSSSIGAAISEDDGATWQKIGKILEAGPPGAWDERGVSRRHNLWLPGGASGYKGSKGLYVMFYEGVSAEGRHSVGLATSPDGLRWEKDKECKTGVPGGPVLAPRWEDPGAWDAAVVAAPCVVQVQDGSFRMYYSGQGQDKKNYGIGLAESNGLDFRAWSRPHIRAGREFLTS